MEIGKTYNIKPKKYTNALSPEKKQAALALLVGDEATEFADAQPLEKGLSFPSISSKYGNECTNDLKPDPIPPAELFNFDLILNGRRFQVMCETILRIKTEEDLADFSEIQLARVLEQCASYRLTCFCAYTGAHRETRKWKDYQVVWMAEKRTEARNLLRTERLADKAASLRKDIGQITMQEVEDYILVHYVIEHTEITDMIAEWEDNEKIFLELRDTLKDRGMHLQTLLKRSSDHTDPAIKGYTQ